jgi:hypothetical protein
MRGFSLLVLFAIAFQDPPQEPAATLAWKIGKNEFARYHAYKTSLESNGEEMVRLNPERLAGLFGYEIADKSLYRPGPLDRMELPLMLGFSLPPKALRPGQSTDWTVDFEECFDCGPVSAKCAATRVAATDVDGVACATIKLTAKLSKSGRAPVAAKPPRAVEKGSFDGTLLFDPAKGVALRLDFTFSLTQAPADPKGAVETIDLRERLEFIELLPVRHRAFEAEVNAAIDLGIKNIWRRLGADGHWGAHYQHTVGPTSLALLTILKGSMDRKDPRLLKAMDWMMAQPLQHTYEVAISLMALEAFYSPGDATARSGPAAAASEKDIASRLDAGHARWGSSAARWLEMNLAEAMWSYPSTDPKARDFSNTQYGILGLYSASRCGFAPDASVIRRVQESYMRAQQKKGPRAELALVEGDPASKTVARFVAEARGWPYYDHPDDPVYGSMTAGGIASLVILDALRKRANDAKYDPREQQRVRAAIRDGWAWLLNRWTVKGNPAHGRDWFYYYLYGLERCGMLDGVARVGDHDWYGEGAMFLTSNQATDGAWFTGKYVNIYDICFAVLFLKRATVRVATGK